MCNFSGMICTICSIILLLKFIARKMNLTKLNNSLRKNHRFIGFIFLATMLIHLAVSIPLFYRNSTAMIIAGLGTVVFGITIIISGMRIGKNRREMTLHRLSSASFLVCLILHLGFK